MNKKLTPLKAVRKNCLWCSNGQPKEVRLCPCLECEMYPCRMGKKEEKGSVIKRIRKKCIDCKGGSFKDVRNCEETECFLHPYREGKSPVHRRSWVNRHKKDEP